jgi:hypothetical protein
MAADLDTSSFLTSMLSLLSILKPTALGYSPSANGTTVNSQSA